MSIELSDRIFAVLFCQCAALLRTRSSRSTMRLPIAFLISLILVCGCTKRKLEERALTPQESLHTIHFSDDFHVELFAAEPGRDEPGRNGFRRERQNLRRRDAGLSVTIRRREIRPARASGSSRIPDGDGKIVRSTVFADNVLAVSGFMPWKGGLIVTSAPDILYS